MKIAIDGLSYFLNKGDVGEYTRGLVNSITPMENDKIYLIKDKEILDRRVGANKLKLSNLYINRLNNDYKSIDDFINNSKIELYHCTNNGFSLAKEHKYNCSVVTTIHSFIPSGYEEFYEENYLKKYYDSLQNWDRYSDAIVCPSRYIEEEIHLNLGINLNKIVVIPPNINKIFTKTNKYMSSVYIKSKFNFSEEFILYCGDIHKRKRLNEVLEIYKRLSYKLPNLKFVILCNIDGTNFKHYKELKEVVEVLDLENKVMFITSYNLSDKVHFYNICKVVIDFSLYEGMCLSLLEAKAVGANIICNDIKTYRESLDDYPLYLNIDLPFIDEILEDYLRCDENYTSEDIYYGEEKKIYNLYESVLGCDR